MKLVLNLLPLLFFMIGVQTLFDNLAFADSEETIRFSKEILTNPNELTPGSANIVKEELDGVLKKEPENIEAIFMRAVARANSWDKEGALLDLQQKLKLDSDYVGYHRDRGIFYNNWREYALAIIEFLEIIKLDPHNVVAYYHIGYAKHELSEYFSSIEYFKKALHENKTAAKPDLKFRGKIYFESALSKAALGDRIGACFDIMHSRKYEYSNQYMSMDVIENNCFPDEFELAHDYYDALVKLVEQNSEITNR